MKNIKIEIKYSLVQKIPETNIIMVLNTENNQTELYSNQIKKICAMQEATVERENDEDIIKIYNNEETRYFDVNGIEIEK